MPSTVQRLTDKRLITPPRFLPPNVCYETIMGSVAYGVASDTSDMDIYGFAIPPKEALFPHLAGEIPGFGRQKERFEQFQIHHVHDPTELSGHGRTYDLQIFNIVKYFQLAMENNPNMIDSLFTPQTCVLHITKVGSMVREQRRIFLHKGAWVKYKGYAYSQLHKLTTKEPQGKRKEMRDKYGFDLKFGYHIVRLLYEAEQILLEGDIDLQRNREHLKAIRRGDIPEVDIRLWAAEKEKQLEKVYLESKLPNQPDEDRIKALLLQCLEEHYGNLEGCVVQPDRAVVVLRQIQEILDGNRGALGI
jgi:predicted nucleotidyltransferase